MKNKKKYNIIIIITISIIILTCLGLLFLSFNNSKNYNKKEYFSNINSQYLNYVLKPKDDNGNTYLPNGYYSINNKYMALIPSSYSITNDSTGIYPKNPNDILNGNSKILDLFNNNNIISNGYYSFELNNSINGNFCGNINGNACSIIYGNNNPYYDSINGNVYYGNLNINNKYLSKIPDNFIMNSSKTGITLDTNSPKVHEVPFNNLFFINTLINGNIYDNDSLSSNNLYYNSNNYDVLYHEEFEFKNLPKESVLDINDPVIYYKPNTFSYGSQYYLPSYEDTVYLNYINTYGIKEHYK